MPKKTFTRKIKIRSIKAAVGTRRKGESKLDLADRISGAPRLIGGQPLQIDLKYVRPDPFQARWLLPPDIRSKFIAGKIDALQAMKQWQDYVSKLKKKDQLAEQEAKRLEEIRTLAASIRAGGQVNPVTAVRQGDYYILEVGERRYWSNVLLVVEGNAEAALIPVIPRETSDVFRQVVENRHSADLNAIALARDIARLLVASGGVPDPGRKLTTLDNYRSVLRDYRIEKQVTQRIVDAMNMKPDTIEDHRQLFDLPDEAIVIADRANLSEKLLREVLAVGDKKWQVRITRCAAEMGLTSATVAWWRKQANLAQAERALRGEISSKRQVDASREWARHLEKLSTPKLLGMSRSDIRAIAAEYARHGNSKQLRKMIRTLEQITAEVDRQKKK